MRIAGGAHTRSRPVTAIESRVQLDARSPPQRLPRLRDSLADPTRGAAQSQRSEVVFNSTRDLLPSERIGHNFPHMHRNCLCDHNSESALRDGRQGAGFMELRSGVKIPPGVCVLVQPLSYPPVGRGYLFARGSEPPARPQFRIGISTRSVNGRIRRFPVRRQNSSPGARSLVADAIAYGHRIAQTSMTFRSVIRIACKTPIRNWHSEAIDASLLPQAIRCRFMVENPSFCTLKFSDSLDYAIRWRSPHAEPPNHNDRKSCSTRREISSPAKELGITFRTGIGIAYVTTIRNRHSETVDKALVLRNSVPG
ncbi:hypothetical protein Taro_053986 [Colocasia esculenta]|uniref:Uncharacterized protein n=1 Tax=Colocasia esculenta TaxID=4460 RepID=A0A843XNQ2_COLES|nr:hypothetical protein [Colocasia esculenta]